jgi:hypothetical protein
VFIQGFCRPDLIAVATATTGLVAGTRIETAEGWQPAETLRIGTRVHTLDGGLRPVCGLDRSRLMPGSVVIRISGGYFDACSDLTLLPQQPILLDTLGLARMPYARLQASELAGFPGITRRRNLMPARLITPQFEEEEAIRANTGVLLLCRGRLPAESAFPAPFRCKDFLGRRAGLVG